MKKFNTKRAVITLIEKRKIRSERETFRSIKIYQAEIDKLAKPLNRLNKTFLSYQREIQKLRSSSKLLGRQDFIFEVFIKQYNQSVVLDWTFQHYELGPDYRSEFKKMIQEVVNMSINRIRQERKQPPRASKWFGKFLTHFSTEDKKVKGRTFIKEGEVLRIYIEKNMSSLYTDKKPIEPRKYVGIELEFCAPIKENLFAIKLFKSGIHKFAQLKKDASLRPLDGEVGYELAILLEESNYKKRLKQLTNLLTEVKAVAVDRRAGLHVHLDMRRRDKDLVYNNLVACQYALLSVVDPRRADNEFCRIVDSRKFPTEFTGEREERYKTINAAAFYKYHTLEVRMHEGSVEYTQISHWVDLLIRIANYSKKIKDDVTKVSVLKKRMDLNKKLYTYMQDRSCHWQLQNTDAGHNLRQRIRRLAETVYTQNDLIQVRPEGRPNQGAIPMPPDFWGAPAPVFTNPFLNLTANAPIGTMNEDDEPDEANDDNPER
jgi:hypothetical protein